MANENLDAALRLINQATTMQFAAADCVAQAVRILQTEIISQNGEQSRASILSSSAKFPVVDHDNLVVHWDGRSHEMGATILLRLFARLARRPGHFVRMNDLLQDVWDGNIKSASTIRSAIMRLKRQLVLGDMQSLANAIRCEGGRYGLVLNGRH